MSVQLRENALTLLSRTTGVDMQGVGQTTLFTVPAGKKLIVTQIIIHTVTGVLGTDYDFGDTLNSDYFAETVDLSSVGAGQYYNFITDGGVPEEVAAGNDFEIDVVSGSVGAETATIDVFGYLV